MRVLDAAQMREADRLTIEEIGIPARVLMESAGRAVVAAIESRYEDLADASVAVVCGRGNNGGDALVAARVLHDRGVDVEVFLVGSLDQVGGDTRANLEVLGRLGRAVVEVPDEQAWDLHVSEIATSDLIVDGLVGTGLREPLRGMLETVVADIDGCGVPVVSIDLPSGLSADTHEVIGPAVHAELTVTLGAPKLPLVLPPGEAHAGEFVVADIGIPRSVVDRVDGPRTLVLTADRLRPSLVPRASDLHKGDAGRVVVVAGSRGKTGAAILAARGALRSGAGLVTVATPDSCLPLVAAAGPEHLTLGLAEDAHDIAVDAALALLAELQVDVLAIGPGLGTSPGAVGLVRRLVDGHRGVLVLDADGLNAFVDEPGQLHGRDDLELVVTPHPGEMARLAGITTSDVQANRLDVARTFATSHRATVVLKGHRTLVATSDGTVFINTTGNPGMATGGTGDVLTGMVAAWIAQLDVERGTCLAVHLHGHAGDLAEADEGELAMIAGDLVERLGDAVLELGASRRVARDPSAPTRDSIDSRR